MSCQCGAPVELLPLVLCGILLLCPLHAVSALERTAELRHGSVPTSRSLLSIPHERGLIEDRRQVWLLGLPMSEQDAVMALLTQAGAHVLHPLPVHHTLHWVIHASKSSVRQLLEAHEELTAAPLPAEFKMAPQMQAALSQEHGSTFGDGQALVKLLGLWPEASASDLAQLASEATLELRKALSASCQVEAFPGRMFLRLTVCRQGAPTAAVWLANRPTITWVEQQHTMQHRSLLAGAITQAPGKLAQAAKGHPAGAPPEGVYKGVASGFFPHWKAGLTGKGQIVGVTDSGLDMDSCMLWDPAFKDWNKAGPNTRMRSLPSWFKQSELNATIRDLITLNPGSIPGKVLVFENHQHRKVVQYVMFGDNTDDYLQGHGTHVSATIAGSVYKHNPLEEPTFGTGVAPHAKVAFFDAATTDAESGTSDYQVYTDQGQDPGNLYELLRQTGARIMSTSIGPPDRTYQAPLCYLMDLYAWNTPDTLHLVAAGNDGLDQAAHKTTGTVLTPATCKNVIAVGASESWTDVPLSAKDPNISLVDKGGQQVDPSLSGFKLPFVPAIYKAGTLQFTNASGKVVLRLDGSQGDFSGMQWTQCIDGDSFYCVDSYTSQLDPVANTKLKLVHTKPIGACSNKRRVPIKERVMVLAKKDPDDWDCDVGASIQELADKRAAAALFWWAHSEDVEDMADVPDTTQMPSAVIQAEGAGAKLDALLSKGVELWAEWLPAPHSQAQPPWENVAFFSSYGSSADWRKYDARIKPELVAPGYVYSAASDGEYSGRMDQCVVKQLMGTSMATPVVAGAAALIRQYFTYGYYPTGAPCSKHKYTPSGALMKAVLIAGTAAMTGISAVNNKPLAPPPSPYQGFGRLDLSTSLPLGKETPHWRMQVVDGEVFKSHGVSHNYTLEVLRNPDGPQKPLVAALVWHDFPGFPGAIKVLVNDLDLVVEGPLPSGSETKKPTAYWGNDKKGGDFLNNVEKVYIPEAKPGMYRFSVASKHIYAGVKAQPYSLVVLGNTKGTLDSPRNPAQKPASQHRKAPRKQQ